MIDNSPYYMVGRNADVVDIPMEHGSISRAHAVFVHHRKGNVYVIDIGSNHGVYINGTRIPSKQTVKITEDDEVRIGASTRLFKLNRTKPQKMANAKVIEAKKTSTTKPAAPRPQKRPEPDSAEWEDAEKKAKMAPKELIRCCHILLKHSESRKPFSWRNPKEKVTRTKEEATAALEEMRAKILE
eukprot:Sspe_Gene.110813::Locus_91893_Transcript_1_1_Confidence_1.000_Length_780::g.110813::m.110813/K13216/PPP1R8, NIPP1; nuclear inhibitor of protein phosphatase 1